MKQDVPCRPPQDPFVYFAQAGDECGPIKIGTSGDVEKRMESLRTGNHLPLTLLAKFVHNQASRAEKKLHEQFADLRLEGEWFRFDDRIIDLITAWRFLDERGDLNKTQPPERFLARMREAQGEILTESSAWAVEWSHVGGCFHIHPLVSAIRMAHDTLLLGHGSPSDFVIVALTRDAESANSIADKLEPWLRSMRTVRLLLESDWYAAWRPGR